MAKTTFRGDYNITLDQSICFGTALAYATAAPIPAPLMRLRAAACK